MTHVHLLLVTTLLWLLLDTFRGSSVEDVEDPVDGVEDKEADGENDAGVGIDYVHVADFRDGRLDDGSSSPQSVNHLGLPCRSI